MLFRSKVSRAEEWIARRLVTASSIVLPNLVLGANAYPEFIGAECRPEKLSDALGAIVRDGARRDTQLAALTAIDEKMRPPGGASPSDCAAAQILALVAKRA